MSNTVVVYHSGYGHTQRMAEAIADTSSKAWFTNKWQDKVFGGFTNSASLNGDKLNTLQYFVLLAGQHGGLWVSLGIKPWRRAMPTQPRARCLPATSKPPACTAHAWQGWRSGSRRLRSLDAMP